jgi:hypothetical protein
MNKNNTLSLLSLLLMLCFCGFAYYLFSKVEKEKNKNELLTEELKKKEAVIKNLLDSNKIILAQSMEANRQLSEYIIKSTENFPPSDTLKRIIEKSESVANEALKLNDLPKYQQAAKLEQEGFSALSQNKFDVALDKFAQVEKVSPSFHMAYEISKLLKKEKPNFENPESQKSIKEKIITNYSWKAPKEQVIILREQVKH